MFHFIKLSRNYWAEDWNGLDVGHRGLGNSYTQVANQKSWCDFSNFFLKGQHCSHIRENTLASMQYAIDHGADMVEFDVQVILHNCIFYVWTRKLIQKTNVPAVSRRAALCLPWVSPLCTDQSQAGPWCDGWRPSQGIFWVFKVISQRPLKDLSLAELQGLKSHHPSEKVAGVKVGSGWFMSSLSSGRDY